MIERKKNIQIMPNEFVGIVKECNKLIDDANKNLGYANIDGVITPIVFVDDYDKLQSDISEKIGELRVYSVALKTDSKKKYQQLIEEFEKKRNAIIDARKEYNEQRIQDAIEIDRKQRYRNV